MITFIVSALVGVVLIIIGISNTKGNISLLHSYHTHRVSKEDIPAFGKSVGLGTIIIGIGIIVFAVLGIITLYTQKEIFTSIATALLIVSIVVGLIITFKALIKYNKGTF